MKWIYIVASLVITAYVLAYMPAYRPLVITGWVSSSVTMYVTLILVGEFNGWRTQVESALAPFVLPFALAREAWDMLRNQCKSRST